MTIITIHQPEHLPWPGFFDKMAQSDIFVLLDDVQFRKDYFQNRNKIKTRDGELFLTVPVLKSSTQLINEIKINNNEKWAKKHWKSIEANYQNAPFFIQYADDLKKIYDKKWENLSDLNIEIIKFIKVALGIKTKLVISSDLKTGGEKTDHLINICNSLNASAYIAGRWALKLEYFKPELFKEKNIKLLFHDYAPVEYHQLFPPFLPYMSTIDLLFNTGPDALNHILNGRKKL